VLEGFLKTKTQHQQAERAGARTTPRETEIIALLAAGKSNKEIAAQLEVTRQNRRDTYRAKIMLKLGLHSLVELVHYAMRRDIATVPVDPAMRSAPDNKP